MDRPVPALRHQPVYFAASAPVLAAALLALPATAVGVDIGGFTEEVTVDPAGQSTFGTRDDLSVSADGRYVAFASDANNLVPGDERLRNFDVFVRDRVTGTTERVNVASNGKPADQVTASLEPSISADGRYVAFQSGASNLDGGDTNNATDVFVHDRLTGETTRVSLTSKGGQASGSSPTISADGTKVAFTSGSPALDVGSASQVFVRDLTTGVTELVSRAPDGSPGNAGSGGDTYLSSDGRFVFFTSFASDLVPDVPDAGLQDAFLFDRQTGTMTAITSQFPPDSIGAVPHGVATGISANGKYLTFTGGDGFEPDDNGAATDAWLVDTTKVPFTYTLVSRNDAGTQADGDSAAGPVSDDGQFVAFESRSTNLDAPEFGGFQVYLRDVVAGTTRRVSVPPAGGELRDATDPAMTPDAQVIAFFLRQGSAFVRDLRPTADVAVSMTDVPDPVLERGQVTYTVTVDNLGTAGATNTTLVDTLPADPTFVSATTDVGTCVRNANSNSGGVLTCDLGTLGVGERATVTIVLEPRAAGTVGNTASVHADQPDPDRTNNSAAQTTSVTPR